MISSHWNSARGMQEVWQRRLRDEQWSGPRLLPPRSGRPKNGELKLKGGGIIRCVDLTPVRHSVALRSLSNQRTATQRVERAPPRRAEEER